MVHAMGYRFRLHRRDLPGRPDLVFASRRAVIFVHGCFWHDHHCQRGRRVPKTHRAYWLRKRGRNRERDAAMRRQLRRRGWRVMVIWECQLRDPAKVARRVHRFLEKP